MAKPLQEGQNCVCAIRPHFTDASFAKWSFGPLSIWIGARPPCATWLSDPPPHYSPSNTWHSPVHSPSRQIIIPLMASPLGTSQAIYCRQVSDYKAMQVLTVKHRSIFCYIINCIVVIFFWMLITFITEKPFVYVQYFCRIFNNYVTDFRLYFQHRGASLLNANMRIVTMLTCWC